MKLAIISIFLIILSVTSVKADFTVSAEVTRSALFNKNISTVSEYFKDISIYQRNFPGIISVSRQNSKESVWTYEVDAPMAEPVRLPFTLVEKSASEDYIIFETKKNSKDYFRCTARLVSLGENETRISITIKIKMVRDSGSDVHFMAPILGEKFISKEMRKDIEDSLAEFLAKCKKELL